MYQVVSFDPGGTTGWAVFSVHEIAMLDPEYPILSNVDFWQAGQFSGPLNSQASEMVGLAEAWDEADLVCEDFLLKAFLPGREVLDPVRLNAIFEFAVSPRPVSYQMPGLALGSITDDRLKDMGYYNPLIGKEHARAAVKHALVWLRRRKKIMEREARRGGRRASGSPDGERSPEAEAAPVG